MRNNITTDSPWRFVHPVNLGLLHGFKRVSAEESFQETMKWVVRACKLHVRVEAGEFLSSGPQLILCNHPGPLDMPILCSIVDRTDAYFLGSAGIQSFSPQIAARMFPIYLSQKPSPYLFTKLKNHIYHRLREGVTREEAQRRNQDSLVRAAQRLNAGATLMLWPTGGTFATTTDWKSGVGQLIQLIDAATTQVVFARIEGSSRRDLARLLNQYWFGPFLKERLVTVRVHAPIPLPEFSRGRETYREISDAVKQGYVNAFGSV